MNKIQIFLCACIVLVIIGLFNLNSLSSYMDNTFRRSIEVENGMKFMDEEKYEEAILSFNNYLNKRFKISNNDLLKQVYYQKSIAYSKLNLYEMCEKYIDLASKINETTFDEKIIKANATYYKGSYDEALDRYSELISIEPKSEFLLSRGDCYIRLKQYDKAVEEFKQLFESDPSFTHFQKLIYSFNMQQNNEIVIETATNYINKLQAGEFFTEDQNEALNYAYSQIGYAHINLKQYKDAISNFSNAVEFNEYDSDSFFELALCHSSLGNYDLAAENLEKALIIDEDYYYIEELEYYDEFLEFIKTDQYKTLRKQYY